MKTAADIADSPAKLSRLTWLAGAVVLFVVTVWLLASVQLAVVLYEAILDGGILTFWLAAAWGIGALAWRSPGDRDADRTLHNVTRVALGLGVMSMSILLLGSIGLMNRFTAIVLIAVGLFMAIRRIYSDRNRVESRLRSPLPTATWLGLMVVPALAIAFVGALVLPGLLWGADDPAGYDVVAYHLQMPREWYELGRVVTLPHNVFSFMPLNVEMHYLLAMELRGGPFAGMYLAQLMHTAFIGLTIGAVYGAARARGPLAASGAAIVCAVVPWMPMLGSVAYNEGGLMLFATLAAVWALRGRWALAGACAGMAAGCKLTGVSAAMVLVPLVVGALSLWERVRVRAVGAAKNIVGDEGPHPSPLPEGEGAATRLSHVARDLSIFGIVALLVFAPWLVRTAIASGGNPIFPLAMNVLGHGNFDAGQIERFVAAHSPRVDQQSLGARLVALRDQVALDAHYGVGSIARFFVITWIILPLAAVVAGWRKRETYIWLALIVGNVLVWLFATHLQGRFLVQIIPCAAQLGSCATHRRRADARGRLRELPFCSLAIFTGCVVSAALTWPTMIQKLRSTEVAIGLPDPSALRELLPPQVAAAIYDSDRPLILVGDAKAFWYAVPESRIRYRSVFDVPSDRSFAAAWLGERPPTDALVIVDPGELERFSRTYKNLPALPEGWRDRRQVFVTDTTLR